MTKKSSGSMYYSPDGWFLNFLFLMILIVGIVSATVLAQRRAILVNKAATKSPPVEVMYDEPMTVEAEK